MKKESLKKLLAVMLTGTMAFSLLVGCGSSTDSADTTDSASTEDAADGADTSVPEEAETIVIGNLQDLTGTAATAGVAMERGVALAVEEINANGGINGKLIEYVSYDTANDPAEALNAYTRLVGDDGAVAVIGPPVSNIGLALTETSTEYEVPIVGAFIDSAATEQEDGTPYEYMFLVQPTNEQCGEIQASYLINELGATKIALFYDQSNAFGVSQVEAFVEYVESHGGEIVCEQLFTSGDTDFKTQLQKIKDSGADGIFAPNYPQDNVLYVTQMDQLGMTDIPTMGGLDFAPPFLSSLSDPEICTNIYYAINIAFDDESIADLNATAIETYSDLNTVDDLSAKLYIGYDAMYMVAAAIEYLGDAEITGEAIKDALENMGPVEVKTGTIEFSDETHQPSGLGMTMYVIEDGETVKIGDYATE